MALKHEYKVVEIGTQKLIATFATPIKAMLFACANKNYKVVDSIF